MSHDVLIVSTMIGVEKCAALVEEQVGARVEVARSRKAALQALRRSEFAVLVVEESMAESDQEWAELVWGLAGMAIPLEVNFGISGGARLSREVRAALLRREGEQAVARKAAVRAVENDLKTAVTGLLLESELALQAAAIPAALEPKLRHLVELAGVLRERLRSSPEERAQG